MSDKVRKYEGEKITVKYEVARCIHAGECAYGLKAVFNPDRKPWVDADAADARFTERICPGSVGVYVGTQPTLIPRMRQGLGVGSVILTVYLVPRAPDPRPE